MTTSTMPDGRPKINVSDPGQLIASIPYLFGFRPENSLVVAGLGGSSGGRLGPVLRLALPPPEHEEEAVAAVMPAFAHNPCGAVIAIVVGAHPGRAPGELPHARLIARLSAAFEELGRPLLNTLWTPEVRGGARWRSYEGDREGELPDQRSTELAAICVSQGQVTYDSREEMAGRLAPDDPAAIARRAALLREQSREPMTFAAGLAEVRRALLLVRNGDLAFGDDQVVRLAEALSNSRVRDTCLATAHGSVAGRPTQAEGLWLELIRRTPPPERAEAASVLGYAAYLRGDGAFARVALENALDADPGHMLSRLLVRCLERGIPPEKLRELGSNEHLDRLLPPAGR
ncbi:DUF4192 domain-containing protein [Amycolatopsis sp.]|uniref:DUF4192 domain-containing protein n=1 Tax=Amycolatopsis sp. TaxID=37632 RepID=UPI002C05CC1D|nr:DUF4192 domain-containing protein [Amycolatopsis sp.]HVV10260.1 DUF4192 domain-containing protein [Amycolatopsis sp.]